MEKKDILEYVYCAKKEAELKEQMKNISTILLGECDISYTYELLNKGIFPAIVSGDSRKILNLVASNSIYILDGIDYEYGIAHLNPTMVDEFDYMCDRDFSSIRKITGKRENNDSVEYEAEDTGAYVNVKDYVKCLMHPVNVNNRNAK